MDKRVIAPGPSSSQGYPAGSRVSVHYVTRRLDTGAVVDDSRSMHNGPFSLLIGKAFIIPQWEQAINTMAMGETALFTFPDAQEVRNDQFDEFVYLHVL